MNTITSPSSVPAKGQRGELGDRPGRAGGREEAGDPVLAVPGPDHGAGTMAAPADQPASPVTRSEMAGTSPEPDAWYSRLAAWTSCPALMIVLLPCTSRSSPESGHGRRVADELLDGADAA